MNPLLMTSSVSIIVERCVAPEATNVALTLDVHRFHVSSEWFGIEKALPALITVQGLVRIAGVATDPVVLQFLFFIEGLWTVLAVEAADIDPS